MIDYKKYFFKDYKKGECDCWTLIQDIYMDMHNIKLPDYPYAIQGNEDSFAQHVFANVELEIVDKADIGCIIYDKGVRNHAGYAIDSSQYIHRTFNGTKITTIPKNVDIYKVLKVK